MPVWCARMARLLDSLHDVDTPTARHIRTAYHLHCLAPHALRPIMTPTLDEDAFEAMLESGAYESATTSLVGALHGEGPDYDGFVASPSNAGRSSGEAQSMAMLGSWAVNFRNSIPVLH